MASPYRIPKTGTVNTSKTTQIAVVPGLGRCTYQPGERIPAHSLEAMTDEQHRAVGLKRAKPAEASQSAE